MTPPVESPQDHPCIPADVRTRTETLPALSPGSKDEDGAKYGSNLGTAHCITEKFSVHDLPQLIGPLQASQSTHLPETNADVRYNDYGFLHLGNLDCLEEKDVEVLEAQGCLRVPTRERLREFLLQYFRHIHPLLPIIHECGFWARFAGEHTSEVYAGGISLLLLQAMLFASCHVSTVQLPPLSFVPLSQH